MLVQDAHLFRTDHCAGRTTERFGVVRIPSDSCACSRNRQRTALFAILGDTIKNWEPVYRILQNDPEIIKDADQTFAFFYESISNGERVPDMTPFLKDKLGNKPN